MYELPRPYPLARDDVVFRPTLQTDLQRANCEQLIAYLCSLPADYRHFRMTVYSDDASREAHVVSCGTAACAVGHGPRAGVSPIGRSEDWESYGNRAFGPELWSWCFSPSWVRVDDTHLGAAARLSIALDRGLPEDAFSQVTRSRSLCYEIPPFEVPVSMPGDDGEEFR